MPGQKDIKTKPYLGYNFAEVMNSPRDVLGEALLKSGPPSYEAMKGALPPVQAGRYAILSGPACWRGLVVLPDGSVYPQQTAQCPEPAPIFTPLEEDADADRAQTTQWLMEDWIPVVTTRYAIGARHMEITLFVEFGDPDSAPQLWVGVAGEGERRCYVVSHSRPMVKRRIEQAEYDDTLSATVAEWRRWMAGGTQFALPHADITTGLRAMMANLFLTFSGDHGHYGHRYYGREIHDNFPPNYLYAAETCHALGYTERAWGMVRHLLLYGVDGQGRFYYRQGLRDWLGASGSEYGRLFWLLERLHLSAPDVYQLEKHADVLERMGDYLLDQVHPHEGGRQLLMMCAEADTRSRIHAYASNNLWGAVGLRALGRLLARLERLRAERYANAAQRLQKDIREALDEERIDSPYGPLVPFQIGYTALPWTLSQCALPETEGDTAFADYFSQLDFDAAIETGQDYSENTYANYRYYGEMLSSGLLAPEEEDAILALRAARGGEVLGMSRLYERLDDWPADNYARHLLQTDRLDKYLLLYYAHILYHGNLDTGVYYEQVTMDGAVFAPDCVPSALLAPLMTAWMFCFEPVEGDEIYFLRGIPGEWYRLGKPISAKGLMCSAGRVDLLVEILEGRVHVQITIGADLERTGRRFFLDLPCRQKPDSGLQAEGAAATPTGRLGRFELYPKANTIDVWMPVE